MEQNRLSAFGRGSQKEHFFENIVLQFFLQNQYSGSLEVYVQSFFFNLALLTILCSETA